MTPWPKDREERLRTLYDAGQTFQQIADDLGMSLRTVQSKASRMCLSRRHVPSRHADPEFLRLRAEGKSAKQIAALMGSTLKRVQNWIGVGISLGLVEKQHVAVVTVWTEPRLAELRRLWATGYGPAAIADMMGMTPSAVGNKARVLNLPRNRPYPIARKAAPPRDYRTEHLVSITRKPRPEVTSETWLKTATCRPFLERERSECAWPLGERGDYHACCAETLEGDSYCEHHRLMAGGMKIRGVRMARPVWKMAA